MLNDKRSAKAIGGKWEGRLTLYECFALVRHFLGLIELLGIENPDAGLIERNQSASHFNLFGGCFSWKYQDNNNTFASPTQRLEAEALGDDSIMRGGHNKLWSHLVQQLVLAAQLLHLVWYPAAAVLLLQVGRGAPADLLVLLEDK